MELFECAVILNDYVCSIQHGPNVVISNLVTSSIILDTRLRLEIFKTLPTSGLINEIF